MQSLNNEKLGGRYEGGDEEKHHQYATGSAEYENTNSGLGEIQIETTRRGLKARHAQMIALGGTIGTVSFLQSSL